MLPPVTAVVDQSFLRIISEVRREIVVDTNQCSSFENKNAFGQEHTFGDITNDFSKWVIILVMAIVL